MRALLIYSRFPKSFWDFEKPLALLGRKAMLPPLGLATVAALLPEDWQLTLVDRNIRQVTEAEWAAADLVLVSGMIAQRADVLALVREAWRRDRTVVVGGPYPTAMPDELQDAGADFLVLDEAEVTVPKFLDALASGATSGIIRSGGKRPALADSPVPRFDLLDLHAYSEMAIQFSRGCPFHCEFCDVTVLYGRRARTKSPEQMLAELQRLYELGWRRNIFMADDNFIAARKSVKAFLRTLRPWMAERGIPFSFDTQASVDLASDAELMDLMTACNFGAVFLGIETPDEDRLQAAGKPQNLREPLEESVDKIVRAGLRVMSGFIIGFDDETPGAGDRIARFVDRAAIPTAFFSMLQALPGTDLWKRLEREGRLRGTASVNQTTLTNFVPTRPIEQIASEYISAFHDLYDPVHYLDRTYRHYRILAEVGQKRPPRQVKEPADWRILRALLLVLWRQGVLRQTRWRFWPYLVRMLRANRRFVPSYLGICGHYEHFAEFRDIVEEQIKAQLTELGTPTTSARPPYPHRPAATSTASDRSPV